MFTVFLFNLGVMISTLPHLEDKFQKSWESLRVWMYHSERILERIVNLTAVRDILGEKKTKMAMSQKCKGYIKNAAFSLSNKRKTSLI